MALDLGTPPVKVAGTGDAIYEFAQAHPDDWPTFRTALADPSWSASALSEAMGRNGHPIGRGAIENHRSGKCSCARRGLV